MTDALVERLRDLLAKAATPFDPTKMYGADYDRQRMADCAEVLRLLPTLLDRIEAIRKDALEEAAIVCARAAEMLDPKKNESERLQWNLACALRDNIRALKSEPPAQGGE